MKEITINKKNLVTTLYKNMETHNKEYNEVMVKYLAMAVKAVDKLLKKLKKGEVNTSLYIDLQKPKSNVQDYKTAIEMLELEVNTNVTISEREFRQYIKNEWEWTRSFEFSKTTYLDQ